MQALVVDDSRATREILADILLEIGFNVLKAEHGLDGLRMLRESGKIDVVLVDWIMPEMDGLCFIRAVRADRAFDAVRLMMVTTQTEMPKVASALDSGADEYVMKPVTREMIEEKLKLLGIAVPETFCQ